MSPDGKAGGRANPRTPGRKEPRTDRQTLLESRFIGNKIIMCNQIKSGKENGRNVLTLVFYLAQCAK